jgi:putative N6-adenine-specific DNA methylase
VEAAMMACQIPPGHLRSFAFQHWQNFNSTLWEKVKKGANDQIIEWEGQIFARDLDARSIDITIQNSTRAGVEDYVMVKKEDFFDSMPKSETGFLIFNPPYGERMRQEQIVDFYKQIGSHLKQHYQNHDAWIISSNMEAIKYFGLKPSKKVALYNGALPCKLQGYELYKGSKRAPLLTEN